MNGLHDASPGPLPHFDDGVVHVRHFLEFPVEEIRVELLGLLRVMRMQLDMREQVCHGVPPFTFV